MTENTIQIVNIVFALGSIPPTILIVLEFIKNFRKKSVKFRATLAAMIFLFSVFLVISILNTVISFFFILNFNEMALHYSELRTLFLDSTWFTVSWALYLVQTKRA